MGSGMQQHGKEGHKECGWVDLGAAMDAEDGEQSIESQEADAVQARGKAITGTTLFELAKSNGFRCALSGAELKPDDASLDHIIPLSKGGAHDMQNVAVIHGAVNRMKGEMKRDEFVRWCKLIARWNG